MDVHSFMEKDNTEKGKGNCRLTLTVGKENYRSSLWRVTRKR